MYAGLLNKLEALFNFEYLSLTVWSLNIMYKNQRYNRSTTKQNTVFLLFFPLGPDHFEHT